MTGAVSLLSLYTFMACTETTLLLSQTRHVSVPYSLLLRSRPTDIAVSKRVVSLWTPTVLINVPLCLPAACMRLKNYAKSWGSHLAYKAHVLYIPGSLHILHAIAIKWYKIRYGHNVLSRPHPVCNIAAVRALDLCGVLIAPQPLISI
jgi:hypothetical protein